MHEKCTFPRAQKAVGRDRVKRTFRADHLMDVKTAQKADFADRLKTAIDRKGWSMSETARRASTFLNGREVWPRPRLALCAGPRSSSVSVPGGAEPGSQHAPG